MIAHVAGLPVEEALVPLLSGAGAGLLAVCARAAAGWRRQQSVRSSTDSEPDRTDYRETAG